MAPCNFNLCPLWYESPRYISIDEDSDKSKGLGTLAMLPLEIRGQIWTSWTKAEPPRVSWRRLRRLSRWLAFESYHVLIADRCLVFDLSSFRPTRGQWISQFNVHDQYGWSWRVAPQFGAKCSTLEGAENLNSVCADVLGSCHKDVSEPNVPVRIKMIAPKDAAETLVLWNRMRWVAHFIWFFTRFNPGWKEHARPPPTPESKSLQKLKRPIYLQFEFLQTSERTWFQEAAETCHLVRSIPTAFSPIFGDRPPGHKIPIRTPAEELLRDHLMSFVVSPFVYWREVCNFYWRQPVGLRRSCHLSGPSHSKVTLRGIFPDPMPSSKRRKWLSHRSRYPNACPNWPRHVLYRLGRTDCANLLRLEMLASTDARRNEAFRLHRDAIYIANGRCRICIDQRTAASAYAPRRRDKMLQVINQTMFDMETRLCHDKRLDQRYDRIHTYAAREDKLVALYGESQSDGGLYLSCKLETPFDERDPIGPAFYYSDWPGHYAASDSPLRFDEYSENNDITVRMLYKWDSHTTVKDSEYGFSEEIRKLQNYWQSLGHWLQEHPVGIPPLTSHEHLTTMANFRWTNKHDKPRHPYPICRCVTRTQYPKYGCFCNDNSLNMAIRSWWKASGANPTFESQQALIKAFDEHEFDFAIPCQDFSSWAGSAPSGVDNGRIRY